MSRLILPKARPVALVTLILTAIVALILRPSTLTAQAGPNWVLQWSDEFSGASGTGVDTSQWKYDTGKGIFGTGEIETMTNSTANVHQDGAGHLVITALRDGSGNWTSGRIETQRSDFQPPAGGMMAVESSFQQPNLSGAAAQGYWPAFWMLGATLRTGGTWPSVGEWDVMEDVDGRSSVYGTLHCGTSPGGPCHETTGIGSGQQPCNGCQTALHTYRIEYDKSVSPEQLRWYLDGVNYFTINSSQLDATTWNNATHRANFIIYDLAMGGGFPGNPTSSTQSGGSM
ncbi:MAG TPA: glycoside hydrolase family 16 protein, partial [Aggregatilineales bacterium]|nr:glycoside hydrolase family 16 protein [Aggregatilineales bacterium]